MDSAGEWWLYEYEPEPSPMAHQWEPTKGRYLKLNNITDMPLFVIDYSGDWSESKRRRDGDQWVLP